MTTRETIERYFELLRQRGAWDTMLADDLAFTSATSPTKHIAGKNAYVQATRRFYSMITDMSVREIIVADDRACALTHYTLAPPNGGAPFESDVAEIFSTANGKIASYSIYFDTAPYPK